MPQRVDAPESTSAKAFSTRAGKLADVLPSRLSRREQLVSVITGEGP